MGFWFFMLAMALMLPLTMFGGSFLMRGLNGAPGGMVGYRTPMSKKNAETWAFANLHCSMIWRRVGAVMLPASIIAMLPCIGKGVDAAGWRGLVVVIVQTAIMLSSIVPTERALRKVFDKNGNRRV